MKKTALISTLITSVALLTSSTSAIAHETETDWTKLPGGHIYADVINDTPINTWVSINANGAYSMAELTQLGRDNFDYVSLYMEYGTPHFTFELETFENNKVNTITVIKEETGIYSICGSYDTPALLASGDDGYNQFCKSRRAGDKKSTRKIKDKIASQQAKYAAL